MPGRQTITLFMISALALNLTPEAAILFILSRSFGQGRAAAVASVFGLDGIGDSGDGSGSRPLGALRLFAARLRDRQIVRRRLSRLSRRRRVAIGRPRQDSPVAPTPVTA